MLFICSYIEQHLRFEHLTYQRLQKTYLIYLVSSQTIIFL